jgi:hypothetical protein
MLRQSYLKSECYLFLKNCISGSPIINKYITKIIAFHKTSFHYLSYLTTIVNKQPVHDSYSNIMGA